MSKANISSVLVSQPLIPTSVKTSAYSASPSDFIPVDVSNGSVAITLPTTPPDKSRIEIKLVNLGSTTNTVTYTTGGSDVINKASGSTTATLSILNQAVMLQYASGSAIWYVQSTDVPLSQTDTRYLQTSNNLSDTVNKLTSRTNLGLAATKYVTDYGTIHGDGTTDDSATFQAALNALVPGDTLILPPRLGLAAKVACYVEGVTIAGAGMGQPRTTDGGAELAVGSRIEILSSYGNTNEVAITFATGSSPTRPAGSVNLKNFILDGAGSNGTPIGTGITGINYQSFKGRVENVGVRYMSGSGFQIQGYTSFHTFDTSLVNLDIGGCTNDGLALLNGAADVQIVSGNFYRNNINLHLYSGASAPQVTGIQTYQAFESTSHTGGINILVENSGSRSQFVNCKIEVPDHENVVINSATSGATDIDFTGCRFKNGSGISNGTYDSVYIVGPTSHGTGRTKFKACTFVYDSGGGANLANYFIHLGDAAWPTAWGGDGVSGGQCAQKTEITGCHFGDGLATGNTQVVSGVLLDHSTAGNPTVTKANVGLLDIPAAPGDKLGLTPTSKSANYTAAAGDFVACGVSTSSLTVTLPTAPSDGSVVAVTIQAISGVNTVTIATGGSDAFYKTGGATSLILSTLNQTVVLQYQLSNAIWYVVASSGTVGDKLGLTPTVVKTAAYAVGIGDYVPCDTNAVGAFTVTLPTAPIDGSVVGFKLVTQTGTNAVTIAAGGSDVFNKTGGSTSLTLSLLNESSILQYRAANGVWYVITDDIPPSQLDLRYQPLNAGLTSIAALSTTTLGRSELTATRTTFSNVATAVVSPTSYEAQTGTMSASRIVTLPAANSLPAGTQLIIADESGTVTATNTVVITCAGSDTFFNTAQITEVIKTPGGFRTLATDGTSKWIVISRPPLLTNDTWHPGILAASVADDSISGTTKTITAATQLFIRIPLLRPITIANVTYEITTAAVTNTHGYIAWYDSSGTMQAQSTDLSTIWQTTGSKTTALSYTPVWTGPDTFGFLMFFTGTAATAPALRAGSPAANALTNLGMTAAGGFRLGTISLSDTATMPNISLSSMASSASVPIALIT